MQRTGSAFGPEQALSDEELSWDEQVFFFFEVRDVQSDSPLIASALLDSPEDMGLRS